MTVSFKCCKNKICQNVVCMGCFGVYHSSCIDRKSPVHVDAHKIICSKDCEKRINDRDRETEILAQKVDELKRLNGDATLEMECVRANLEGQIRHLAAENDRLILENGEMSRHLQRIRGQNHDFEEEVLARERDCEARLSRQDDIIRDLNREVLKLSHKSTGLSADHDDALAAERQLEEELSRHKKTIVDLNREIDRLKESDSLLREEISELESGMKELETCVEELRRLNRDLLATMETLRRDNECNVGQPDVAGCTVDRGRRGNLDETVSEAVTSRESDYFLGVKRSAVDVVELQSAEESKVGDSGVPELPQSVETILERKSNSADEADDAGISQYSGCQRYQRKKRVLIFGDESGRGLSAELASVLDGREYYTYGVIHSGCGLSKISDDIFEVSRCLTADDYIVLTLNADNSSKITKRQFEKVLSVGRYTNVIFCLKCFYKCDAVKKNFNSLVDNCLMLRRNVSFRYMYDICAGRRESLRYLVQNIVEYVRCRRVNHSIVLRSLTSGMRRGSNPDKQFFRTSIPSVLTDTC